MRGSAHGRAGGDADDALGERGSALVEFLLVGALTSVLALGILQVAFLLHVRNTVADAAGEGARLATLEGATPADAVRRTGDLIGTAIGPSYGTDIAVATRADRGVLIVEVIVSCPMTLAASLLPVGTVPISGIAVRPLTPHERGERP